MTDKLKKQIILNLPYLIFVYLFDKLCQGIRLAPGADASEKLLHIGQGFSAAFASLAPSFHLLGLCMGAAGAVLIRLAVYSKGKNAKKYRRGIEYGSARWGTPADIAPYADPDFFQNVLLTQTERITMSSRPKEADRVAQALDLYVNGSLNFFNHRTTVDIRNRLVCFDIKGLGKNLKKPGMLIVQDAVWNTVTINRAIGRSTWYFVDEFHLLLKEEQTAAYSAEIWKRFRKWGGVPTGATQNPKDLLSSPEIENILENSDFIYMLNQAAGDRKILAERLGISAEQLAYVTNSEPGHGLLFFNNVILPFADDFPKDTELYKLLTTKPSEVEHAAETEA